MNHYSEWDYSERHIRILHDESGSPVKVEKRLKAQLRPLYEQLKTIEHPNLPRIYDIADGEDCIIVTEGYIPGISLQRYLTEAGPQGDEFVMRCARDLTAALIKLHSFAPALIHRDIKPENIIYTENGGFVLIDFDAARRHDPSAKSDTELIGTHGYAAPEQYGFAQTDARSDIYSLGVVLFELRMGRLCGKGDRCEGKMARIIERCIAFDADRRFQSAKELEKALKQKQNTKRLLWGLILAAVICVLCLAAVLWKRPNMPQHNDALPANTPGLPQQETILPPIETEKGVPAVAADVMKAGRTVEGCTCTLPDNIPEMQHFALPGRMQIVAGESITIPFGVNIPQVQQFCTAQEHSVPEYRYYLTEESRTLGDVLHADHTISVSQFGEHGYRVEAELNGRSYNYLYQFHVTEAEIVETVSAEPAVHTDCTCVAYWVEDDVHYRLPHREFGLPAGHNTVLPLEMVAAVDSTCCTAQQHNDPVITFALSESAIAMGDAIVENGVFVFAAGEHVIEYYVALNDVIWKNTTSFTVEII